MTLLYKLWTDLISMIFVTEHDQSSNDIKLPSLKVKLVHAEEIINIYYYLYARFHWKVVMNHKFSATCKWNKRFYRYFRNLKNKDLKVNYYHSEPVRRSKIIHGISNFLRTILEYAFYSQKLSNNSIKKHTFLLFFPTGSLGLSAVIDVISQKNASCHVWCITLYNPEIPYQEYI